MAELWMLISAMRLALLEQIAAARLLVCLHDPSASDGIQRLVRSLQEINQTSWKSHPRAADLFDPFCRDDPAELIPAWI